MVIFLVIPTESFALDLTHKIQTCSHLVVGIILFRFTILEKKARSEASMAHIFAVTLLIITMMDSPSWPVVIDKRTYLNYGTLEIWKKSVISTGMAQKHLLWPMETRVWRKKKGTKIWKKILHQLVHLKKLKSQQRQRDIPVNIKHLLFTLANSARTLTQSWLVVQGAMKSGFLTSNKEIFFAKFLICLELFLLWPKPTHPPISRSDQQTRKLGSWPKENSPPCRKYDLHN